MRTIKLSRSMLAKIIQEEVKKFKAMKTTKEKAKETKEVEPSDLADTIVKQVNFAKALKIEEQRVARKLKVIREARIRALKKIADSK